MEFTVTRKGHYGYVGPVKRPSTLIKVNGKTVGRVFEHQGIRGTWVAEFSTNGGRTYNLRGYGPRGTDRAEVITKAEKEAVKIAKDLAKEGK